MLRRCRPDPSHLPHPITIDGMSTAPRLAAAKHDWGHDERGCTVLHVDMDAFYASCEVARHPELKGRPLIIGTGSRAVVSAASYEARRYGVNSAMPVTRARRLCPQGIFLPVDMSYYRGISRRIFGEVFAAVTDRVEQVSVDEGYMDVSGALLRWHRPSVIGAWIRRQVRERFHVTCSVGIAANKLVAKMASTNAKPDGMLLIPAARHAEFVQMMPLRGIPGIGPSMERRLLAWGVNDVAGLAMLGESELARATGSHAAARLLYEASRGIDTRVVTPRSAEKAIGAERTFARDTRRSQEVTALLRRCADEVGTSLRRRGLLARTVTVKLRFTDLSYATKSHTAERPMQHAAQIYPIALVQLHSMLSMDADADEEELPRPIRLAGVSVSTLSRIADTPVQPSLDELADEPTRGLGNDSSDERARTERLSRAEHALDSIRERYGGSSVRLGW